MRGLSENPTGAVGASQAAQAVSIAAAPGATSVDAQELQRSLNDTLRQAIERHGGRVVLLCSFQKEESVLIDELLRIGEGKTDVRIATIDTGVLFEETMETWRAFEQRFGIDVEVFDASEAGGNAKPWSGPEHCCSAAKVAALESILQDASAWITGIRREQGPTRADTALLEVDAKRGIDKYNPLALWTEKDLWRRINAHDLPYNPLHDQGYASIGCAPCTLPGSGRDGRWAGTVKTECGLHV